jgi:hypothetical protein
MIAATNNHQQNQLLQGELETARRYPQVLNIILGFASRLITIFKISTTSPSKSWSLIVVKDHERSAGTGILSRRHFAGPTPMQYKM